MVLDTSFESCGKVAIFHLRQRPEIGFGRGVNWFSKRRKQVLNSAKTIVVNLREQGGCPRRVGGVLGFRMNVINPITDIGLHGFDPDEFRLEAISKTL